LARRHLGFTIEEWEQLPWHHQQTYLQELVAEFSQQFEALTEEDDESALERAQQMGLNVQRV